jgi:hypothetical protein
MTVALVDLCLPFGLVASSLPLLEVFRRSLRLVRCIEASSKCCTVECLGMLFHSFKWKITVAIRYYILD